MSTNVIDAELLAKMFLAGAQNLDAKKDWINELNVFPVPDGDTGTNMTMTIMSAAREVQGIADVSMQSLAKAISTGSLRGARGNSGVILSQLFRGFTKTVKNSDEINVQLIAEACEKAVETAYKAVIKPKEGTILTVAKGISVKAIELAKQDDIAMEEFIREVLAHGNAVLASTPDLLPVLKEAGVVDSGGQGLLTVLEGAFDAFLGKEIKFEKVEATGARAGADMVTPEEEIRFGYCTEFIINIDKPLTSAQVDELRAFLLGMGDSLVLVPDAELIKIHVHTNEPGVAITKALEYGPLTNMKIDNMRVEHQEKLIKEASKVAREQKEALKKNEPPKQVGFVTVSVGDGFEEIFNGLDVDYVISGGQTMNPSTEDVLNAIDQVNAENIFIFPNNKNIIMAANQARELVQEKNIIVIPTTTVPQGITALISYEHEKTVEENQQTMNEVIGSVQTAEITYAVRDTKIDDVEIHQGDIMAVGDNGILAVTKTIEETAKIAVSKMVTDESVLISIYNGAEYSDEDADKLREAFQSKYADLDVELNPGGQPVYYCVISVE